MYRFLWKIVIPAVLARITESHVDENVGNPPSENCSLILNVLENPPSENCSLILNVLMISINFP